MKHFFIRIPLFFIILIFSNCEETINDSIGNDTFSCRIDGKLFVPKAGNGIGGGKTRPFSWGYTNFDKSENPFHFSIYSTGDYILSIKIINPELGTNILNEPLIHTFDIGHTGMIVHNNIQFFNTKDKQENGFVNFTELSATRAIGTFECTLFDKNGKELKVTQGKFNLSIDSSTN